MTKRELRIRSAALVGVAAMLAGDASAIAPRAEAGRAWGPALAALGDTVARSDQPGAGAPLVAVPALVAAGVDASAGLADSAAPRAVETPVGRDETERWVPALAFTSGVLGQGADGSVSTDSELTYRYFGQTAGVVPSYFQPCASFVGSCPQQAVLAPFDDLVTRSLAEGKGENFTAQIVPPPANGVVITGIVNPSRVLPTSGSDLYLTPFVGASLELMTPGVQEIPGRPRLFVHGDASLGFAFERPVAKEGVPEGAQIPDPARPAYTETEVKGVGSQTAGEVQTRLLSGGIGAAFTIDAWERRFRIKPSFEYMRQKIDVTGRLTRAFRKDTGLQKNISFGRLPGRGNSGPVDLPAEFLAPIDIEAADTESFHGIGPGLEIEMDAARAGPVMLTLFLTGRAYKMLGDLDVSLQGSQTITDPDLVGDDDFLDTPKSVSARFDFNIHSWSYLGGLGLRFRWLPED